MVLWMVPVLLLQEEMAATIGALHDDLPTNEDELDAEPAMLAAIQLVEKAASFFEGETKHSFSGVDLMRKHDANKTLGRGL